MSNKKISFVIPVYNTEQYLEKCIHSIYSYSDGVEKEIIVVNDCSPGSCDPIIEKFQGIKYIRFKTNKSVFQARLEGIKAATGDYICFIDSDDYFSVLDSRSIINEFEQDPETDCLIFDLVRQNGEECMPFIETKKTLYGNQILEELCNYGLKWNLADKFFRTECLKKLIKDNIFNDEYTNMCEDFCLFVCSTRYIRKIKRSYSKTCYYYRESPTSATNNKNISITHIIKNIKAYGTVRDLVLNCFKKCKASTIEMEKIDELHFWNLTWYYSTFIAHRELEEKVSLVGEILNSFNRDRAIHYLLNTDFITLAHYAKSNRGNRKLVSNIGIIVNALGGGGTERVAVNLANMFVNKGYSVELVYENKLKQEYEVDPEVEKFLINGTGYRRYQVLLRYLQSKKSETLIFVDYYKVQTMKDIVWAKLNGFNVIAMEHNMYFVPLYTNYLDLFYARELAYQAVDALTCLSEMDLFAWKSCGIDNVFLVPNSNTFESCKSVSKEGRKYNNILFIGRLTNHKGLNFIPDLLSEIRKAIPDFILYLVGTFVNAEEEQFFWRQIKALELAPHVKYVGQEADVRKYYMESKVHIMLSLFEGLPMVMIEAKTYGLPSVIFDMKYILNSDELGGCVQIPYGNVKAMSNEIVKLLEDKEYWQNMSDRARESVHSFQQEKVFAIWEKIFDLIGKQKSLGKDASVHKSAEIFMHEFSKSLRYLTFGACVSNNTIQNSVTPFVLDVVEMAQRILPPYSMRRKIVKYLIEKIRCCQKIR